MSEGCRDSLISWNGILIDGHNRYEICNKHNIPFKIINQDLPSRSDALIWVIDNQRGRRNINELTNCYLIGKRYNTENLGKGNNKESIKRRVNTSSVSLLDGKSTAEIIGDQSRKSHNSVIYNSKFAIALESIEIKTGIQKYEFLLGNIKTTMRDLIDLNKLGLDKIFRVIAKVQDGKESDIKNGDNAVKIEDRDK